jgi:putative NADH-flavin reductase
VAGQDGVLVALGPRSPFDGAVMTTSLGRIVPAMTANGVQRLVLLSALGLGDGVGKAPLLMTLVGRSLLRRPANDKRASERLLRGTDLDWLTIYPGALTGGDGTGSYRLNSVGRARGFPRIARADVARCMLDEVEHPTIHKAAAVVVASR